MTSRRRRGQLVLLAAAVVVTALVPMLLAYAQLGATDPAVTTSTAERAALTDARRTLERSVDETTLLLANDTDASSHDAVARSAIGQFERTATAISTSGADRGAVVSVARNTTAARRWARGDCPRGPNRAFGTCVVTDGVVTQTRGNSTALVAVAVDISVRSPDADMRTTVVVRGVRGVVAADAAPRSP